MSYPKYFVYILVSCVDQCFRKKVKVSTNMTRGGQNLITELNHVLDQVIVRPRGVHMIIFLNRGVLKVDKGGDAAPALKKSLNGRGGGGGGGGIRFFFPFPK